MYKQYLNQALYILKENKLLSIIFIVGTTFHIDFSILHFIICMIITYLLMMLMVGIGIWYPSKIAFRILRVESLRDE